MLVTQEAGTHFKNLIYSLLLMFWNKKVKDYQDVVVSFFVWYRLPLNKTNALFLSCQTHTYIHEWRTTDNLLKATILLMWCVCIITLVTNGFNVQWWKTKMVNVIFLWKRCNLNNIPSRDWLSWVAIVADNIIPFYTLSLSMCTRNMWGVCIHDFINKRKREK